MKEDENIVYTKRSTYTCDIDDSECIINILKKMHMMLCNEPMANTY